MKRPQQQQNTIPWLTTSITALTVLLFLIFGAAPETLVYNREALAHGEVWRLLSGHFVHCDIEHLVWNVGALLILGSLAEQRLGKRSLSLLIISCLGVSGYLWFCLVDLQIYCGLSGALNGLLAVVLALLWSETNHPVLPFLALGSVAKIIIELMTQHALFTDISWASVPAAHGAGLVVGMVYITTKHISTTKLNPAAQGSPPYLS